MKKFPKPWYRPHRGLWYVTLNGKQHNLGPNEAEAFDRYAKLLAAAQQQQPVMQSDSVVAIIDEFLHWLHRNRSAGTYGWFHYRLERFARKYPNLSAADLRPHHVQVWVDGYTLSKTSRRNYLRSVKRCLDWATKQGYLERSPIAQLEVPAAEQRENPVTPEAFRGLLAAAQKPQHRDLLNLAWLSGARPQELIRAEAHHLDAKNHRLVFSLKQSKGKKKVRVVYLPGEAWEIFQRLAKQHPTGPLLRTSQGAPWTTSAVNCLMCRLRDRTGLKYALYDFRHGYATRMLQTGVDPVTVGVLMGHSNPAMVASVYQHLAQSPKFMLEQATRATS